MPEFYFDIETAPYEQCRTDELASLDPSKAKVITIQYQQLDAKTGEAVGDLTILKEWETGSEDALLQKFRPLFIEKGIWNFIPVGNNLAFECKFMKTKLKQFCKMEGLKLGHRPMIDIRHVLVIANGGSFKGYDRLLGKSHLAANMAGWYYDKNWNMIEQYVRQEASDFIKAYVILKRELPKISLIPAVEQPPRQS